VLARDASARRLPRFLFLLHQHAALNPNVTSRKRFYDRVRVTIAIVTPWVLESRGDRLVRFHRRIYRRKTMLRVAVRSSESFLLLSVPEIGISSALKLTVRPTKLRRFFCLFYFAAVTSSQLIFFGFRGLDRLMSRWYCKLQKNRYFDSERQPIGIFYLYLILPWRAFAF